MKSNYSASEENKISFCWQNGSFLQYDTNFNSERVVRDDYNNKLDLERLRRHDIILELIANEAYKGEVYTAASFAKCFEGKLGLGSERSIRERISHLATIGYIKFFKKAVRSSTRSKYGYLCVRDMELKIAENQYRLVKPDYYLSSNNGVTLPVENPDIWVMRDLTKLDWQIGKLKNLPICQSEFSKNTRKSISYIVLYKRQIGKMAKSCQLEGVAKSALLRLVSASWQIGKLPYIYKYTMIIS